MTPSLRAGIIAAGDGLRLAGAFPGLPKPLVPVHGRPLVDWVVGSLRAAGARSIVVFLNTQGRAARGHLKTGFPDVQWTFLSRDTRSSWETFRLVSRALAGTSERFLVSTVDALVPPPEAARFAREACAAMLAGAQGALALTRFVDDEKPLWAQLGDDGFVTALGDDVRRREHATCGLYAMTRSAAEAMPGPEAHGRLRDYWIALIRGGACILGVPLAKTLDVDRPQDLAQAEEFLKTL